jgi:large subunit ribosomal protein L32
VFPVAVPKKKTSQARKGWRRNHLALDAPRLGRCPRCNQPVMPHRMCDECGHYAGLEVEAKDELES